MMAPAGGSSVSVFLARHLKGYAERLGVDFRAIARAAGVDVAAFGDGRNRVSNRQFQAMWQKMAAVSNDPRPGLSFGLEVAKVYPGGSILFTMMMNCPTIGRALEVFLRYHRIMADAIQPRLERQGETIHLFWVSDPGGFPPHQDLSEALLYILYSILAHLSRGRLKPIEVCFKHPRPEDSGAYARVFNAPLGFDAQRDELIIAAQALTLEIRLADQDLFDVLERHADTLLDAVAVEKQWSRKVMHQIREMLFEGAIPDIDAVSRSLALSRRSLQAQLKKEANTYRNCLETIRKQMALEFLALPDVAIGEVAFLLGYSEQSAFNHAFKRWTGKSPKTVREAPEPLTGVVYTGGK